jgi:hypothetical protein
VVTLDEQKMGFINGYIGVDRYKFKLRYITHFLYLIRNGWEDTIRPPWQESNLRFLDLWEEQYIDKASF